MIKRKVQRESGQAVIGMTIVISLALTFLLMRIHEATVRTFVQTLHYNEISVVRSGFEKAAKQLRYMYANIADCDPQAFSRLIASMPDPVGMLGDPNGTAMCQIAAPPANPAAPIPSCRAIPITSAAETAGGQRPLPSMYVMVGAIVFNRVDPCIDPTPPAIAPPPPPPLPSIAGEPYVNDLGIDPASTCDSLIPTSGVGVHLRTMYNDMNYSQWIVLIDTCSTNHSSPTLGATATNYGMGMGKSRGTNTGAWQLGSLYIPAIGAQTSPQGVFPPSLAGIATGAPPQQNPVLYLRQLALVNQWQSASSPPQTAAAAAAVLQPWDLNQDGVVDERDLNIYEKYLTGWIPTIPVRR